MSFAFDFECGDFVVKDGRVVKSDDIRIWIEKILRTQKGRFRIYENTSYGVDIEDLIIGNNLPLSFIESEIKREVEAALLQNPRIKAVRNLKIINRNTVEFEVDYDETRDTFSFAL